MPDRRTRPDDTGRAEGTVAPPRDELRPPPEPGPRRRLDPQPVRRPGLRDRVRLQGVWPVATSALLVVLFIQVFALVTPVPAAQESHAVLPDPFPPYSHLASTVERDPAGPALMTFTYGIGVEFMDVPRAVALGADGLTYRHLRTAELAGTADDQGDPGPLLLSPDGTAAAVGTTGGGGRLTVVDLLTGDQHRWAIRPGSSVFPAAWSSDGSSVFVTTSGDAVNKYSGSRPTGDWKLHRVDRQAAGGGAVVTLPSDADRQATLAALPGSEGLLVATGGVTELRTADGVTVTVADTGAPNRLEPNGMSPDAQHLATVVQGGSASSVEVLPFRDGRVAGSSPVSFEGDQATALGWLDESRVLVGTYDNDTNALRLHLWELDVTTGVSRELVVAQPGWTGASVWTISVAGDLLQGAAVEPVDGTDRGYAYLTVRSLAWVLTLVLLHRVWRTWRPRRTEGPAPG